ncbi:unnamed protein product [Prorocentrum cordatum]|uniref:Uncharacterized protein n=1 Tax=Prorocentrum cordatum TaxID=2364126 RepID=A0ABN9R596_9DINO|nr:unnamed protein product [Polarella glacialis]
MRRRRVRSARGRGSPRRWSLNREGGDQGEGREEEGGVERPGITNYGGWAPGARRRLASERVRARHVHEPPLMGTRTGSESAAR